MGGEMTTLALCLWDDPQCTAANLRLIAFVVGVGLLSFIVWRVLCWLDGWSYKLWEKDLEK